MRHAHHLTMVLALLLLAPASRGAQTPPTTQPAQVLTSAINRLLTLVEPPAGASPRTFSAQLAVTRAEGLPQMVKAASLDLAWQAPDHLRAVAHVGGESFSIGRDGQELWIQRSSRSFGLVGVPGLPKFLDDPATIDTTALAPVSVPMAARMQLAMFPMLMQARLMPEQTIGGEPCHVLALNMPPGLGELLKVNSAELELAIRKKDDLPARIRFADGRTINVELELRDIALGEPWSAEKWKIQMPAGVAPQRAALSHVTNFLRVLSQMPSNRIPTLGPATGNRSVVATAGQGRLELWDDTRVLFLKGTPQEMGRQHGTLLKKQIRSTVDHMLYGIGVGSSFDKGTWFFGEIERAQKRLKPFMSPRYLAEMDALAEASGISWQEIHLSNYFPELFHCSGFAIMGDATVGGRLYHGRVLDYLKGVGLEQNAVVTVYQPDEGNAWVNIGYAGFIGSVTAMNEKQVAIGEMGGRGEGNWDGKPMAQLVREVMEKANTMEEAVEIMRRGPRTCEYYFVISDGKTKRAIAIEATPDKFVTVAPGQTHPKLQHAVKDAVLISGGDRYEKLVERVKENYGKLDMEGARALMNRPVCMTSNIHSVLFAPETLDFWVANADSKNVASHTRYTHYNLREMLAGAAAAAR